MSELNSIVTARRVKRGGTETIILVADTGDIIQDIIGTNSDGTANVFPDFTVATNQSTIYPVITVSIKTGQVVPTNPLWYYNGTAIAFTNNISTGALANKFQMVTRQSDGMPGLKIIGNLASADNTDNDTISFTGTVTAGGFSRTISKNYTILIQERGADARVGWISYPDGKNGVIESQTDSVQLKANLRQGTYTIPDAEYTVVWRKLNGTTWELLKNSSGVQVTGKTITVTEDMVNSFQLIMCEFYDTSGLLITTDTTQVTDASDPLMILTTAVPTDETLINDDDTVVYTPSVASRSNTSAAISGFSFSYNVIKPDGTSYRTAAGASITITVADSDGVGGGDVDTIITASND